MLGNAQLGLLCRTEEVASKVKYEHRTLAKRMKKGIQNNSERVGQCAMYTNPAVIRRIGGMSIAVMRK